MRRFLRPAMFGPAGPSAQSVTSHPTLISMWSATYATKAKKTTPKKKPSPAKKITPPKKKQTPVKKAVKKAKPVTGMSRTRKRPAIDGTWYTTKNTEMLALAVQHQRTPISDTNYITNRAKSLMYYWLYLVGTQSYNPEILSGIMGKNFVADFKQSRVLSHVSDTTALLVFLNDRAKNIAFRHRGVHNFTANVLPDGQIDVHANFEENGVDKEGQKYATHSAHHWVMSSNPSEPFARFEQCRIIARLFCYYPILPDTRFFWGRSISR